MTLEEACRAGSFSVEQVTVGLDGIRRSARRLGNAIMITRLTNDPRLPAVLRPVPSAVRDPRFQLNRAAPAQIKAPLPPTDPRVHLGLPATDPRVHLAVAPTDPRLNLGIVKSHDPRLRAAFDVIWGLLRRRGMTWADCFQEQFPRA